MVLFGALPAAADPVLLARDTAADVSAADVERFANAYTAIQDTQAEAEAKMVAAVEAEGLTLEEFNSLVAAAAQQNSDVSTTMPAETAEQFDSAIEQIIAIRTDAQSEMQSEIVAEGLEIETFNTILEQARGDLELQERIRAELEAE
jgi:hypothetical protein